MVRLFPNRMWSEPCLGTLRQSISVDPSSAEVSLKISLSLNTERDSLARELRLPLADALIQNSSSSDWSLCYELIIHSEKHFPRRAGSRLRSFNARNIRLLMILTWSCEDTGGSCTSWTAHQLITGNQSTEGEENTSSTQKGKTPESTPILLALTAAPNLRAFVVTVLFFFFSV